MSSYNVITVKDVQEIQALLGGITSWEREVLLACRSVMAHGNGSFQFKVHEGKWHVAETTRIREGAI
jgi:hypothetical protein